MEVRPIRLLSLLDDTVVENDGRGLVVVSCWGEHRLASPGSLVRDLLSRMALGPIDPRNALPGPNDPRGREERAHVQRVLHELQGCLVHSLGDESAAGPLLSVEPVALRAAFALPEYVARRPVRLSRFSVVRAADGQVVVESPLALHRVVLHRPEAGRVVAALAWNNTAEDVAASLHDLPPAVAAEAVSFLAAADVACFSEGVPDRRDRPALRDDDPRLAPWSAYDLLFHARRRPGRNGDSLASVHCSEFGGSSPPARRVPLPPPRSPEGEGLQAPTQLRSSPLDGTDLGVLLSRAPVPPGASDGGGGTEGIGLYATVHRCRGVARGIYRYDAHRHELVLVNQTEPAIAAVLEGSAIASGRRDWPAVLLMITAHMPAIPRPFRLSAYALALVRSGAVLERLGQAADEVGLSASVPLCGDNEAATEALKLDGVADVPLGEFAVGV